jgi:hypothetical protein
MFINEVTIPGLEAADKPKRTVKPRAVKAEIVKPDLTITETRWAVRTYVKHEDGTPWQTIESPLDKWSRPNPYDQGSRRLIDAEGAARIMASWEEAMYKHQRYMVRRADGSAFMLTPTNYAGMETYSYQAEVED